MANYFYKGIATLCEDGRTRKVRSRHHVYDGSVAEDYANFVPAYLQFRRKNVKGFVTIKDDALRFYAFNDCQPEGWPERPKG